MKKGIKRFWFILMWSAVPLVSAAPLSTLQEARPYIATLARSGPAAFPKALRPKPRIFYGVASWYSETDPGINLHTANGEVFEDTKMTCASWDFPFGTYLRVENKKNGKSMICRVNDRGPAKRLNRLIDLTKGGFQKIADLRQGLISVSVTPLTGYKIAISKNGRVTYESQTVPA